jgi:hypothetical protein
VVEGRARRVLLYFGTALTDTDVPEILDRPVELA